MTPSSELTLQHKYDLLLHIAQQTRATLDLDTILNVLLDQVKGLVSYDAAGIFIRTAELTPSRPPSTYPASRPGGLPAITGVARRGFNSIPVNRDRMLMDGEGIIGYVIRSGESVLLDDVRQDARYIAGRGSSLSELAVPILLGERVIGALNLESDQLGSFTETHLEVLRFFADAAAITLEKAMLHINLMEKEHLEDQLRTARLVQARLLPARAPHLPGYDIDAFSQPAYDIGGDYYDYLDLEGERLGLVIADVSGDGVPAALVMSAFRALLRTYARRESNPAQVVQIINRLLPDFCGRGDFVTCFYAVLESLSGRIHYVNGGHNHPIHVRSACDAQRLATHGPALGVQSEAHFETQNLQLEPGEQIIFYTDGVVEQDNGQGDFFGLQRLEEVLCQFAGRPAKEIIQGVVKAVQEFAQKEIFNDDFTLMVVRRIP